MWADCQVEQWYEELFAGTVAFHNTEMCRLVLPVIM